MTRELLCNACNRTRYMLTKIDRENGYRERVESFQVRSPAQHGYYERGEFIRLYEVKCDHCDTVFHDGHLAVAVTVWNVRIEPQEPERWEVEFGAKL